MSGARRFFDIHQKLGGIVQPTRCKQSSPRSGFLVVGQDCAARCQARESRAGLEDEVRLPRDPEARALEMRENPSVPDRLGVGGSAGSAASGDAGATVCPGTEAACACAHAAERCNRHEQNSPDQGSRAWDGRSSGL